MRTGSRVADVLPVLPNGLAPALIIDGPRSRARETKQETGKRAAKASPPLRGRGARAVGGHMPAALAGMHHDTVHDRDVDLRERNLPGGQAEQVPVEHD